MNINPSNSAINLITHSQNKATQAAQTIASLPVAKNEVGSADYNANDLIKPVLSLKEAELENAAAVKLLQTDQEMKGRLLNEHA